MKKSKGFTLVELIIVMILVAVLSGIGVPVIVSCTKALTLLTSRSDLNQNADVAINRIAREINRLKDAGSISNAATEQFEFDNKDSLTVNFNWSGTDNYLRLGTDILADRISSCRFVYYDNDEIELSIPVALTQIRGIGVNLIFQPGDLNIKSRIMPFNIRHKSYEFY